MLLLISIGLYETISKSVSTQINFKCLCVDEVNHLECLVKCQIYIFMLKTKSKT